MEGGREERYGFRKVLGERLPVYSGNNALYDNANSVRPEGATSNSLFLGVYAPDEIRKQRLLARSPDLLKDNPAEVEYRLGDSSDNILSHIHLVVDNYGDLMEIATVEVVQLIEFIHKMLMSPIIAVGMPKEQYRGKIIRVATQQMRFRDGIEREFEFAERSPGVRILVSNGGEILLTREWRSETTNWDYRLPGGKVFDSLKDHLSQSENVTPNLSHLAALAAKKELHEETGLDFPLELFKHIHCSGCGATIIWDLHYYLVEISKQNVELKSITTSEGEQTHPQWVSYETVKKLCFESKIQEDRTVAVLLRYLFSQG